MTVQIPKASPLAELATSFARSLRAARKSPRTIEVYMRAILEYDRYATAEGMPRDVSRIKRSHVEQWMEFMDAKGNAPATVSVRHAGLRRFLAWCVEEGEVGTSPMVKVRPPAIPETLPIVLTDAQVDALVAACDGPTFRQRRDAALLLFMSDTGCRRSEVAGIRVDQIDQEHQVAIVTGKGDKLREVLYSTRTVAAIDRYLRLRKKHRMSASPMLWLSGGPTGVLSGDGIAETVARRSRMAGILRPDGRPLHPHLLRHHMADRSLRNGISEGDLAAQGGWVPGSTEMARYGRANRTERSHVAFRKMFGD